MQLSLQFAIDGTVERVVNGFMSLPLLAALILLVIGTFWYFGERRA
jgi:hypothetical protein